MKVFTLTDFQGHYPNNKTAAVVVDASREQAARRLEKLFASQGFPQKVNEDELVELPSDSVYCAVLADGNFYNYTDGF